MDDEDDTVSDDEDDTVLDDGKKVFDQGAAEMEGVDEYLPTRTMTAEERARHRLPKREREETEAKKATAKTEETTSAAMSSLQAAIAVDGGIPIEQEDAILFEGRHEVWNGNCNNDDNISLSSIKTADMVDPNKDRGVDPYDDDGL